MATAQSEIQVSAAKTLQAGGGPLRWVRAIRAILLLPLGLILGAGTSSAPLAWASPGAASASGDSGSASEEEGPCGAMDPDCSRRLGRVLNGVHIGAFEIEGGVRTGSGPLEGAIRFGLEGVSADTRLGDLKLLAFDATWIPGSGYRIRLTTVQSDALFFCRDEEGTLHAPIVALLAACKPEAIWAVSGNLLTLQSDQERDRERLAMRWLELNAVLGLLQNGGSVEYLRQRLNLYLGASFDSVFQGENSWTGVRGNFGISGMIRSRNNAWELQGMAGVRPNLTDWSDIGIETRLSLVRNILVGRNVLLTPGLTFNYTHWTRPDRSIGSYSSIQEQDSLFVGLVFGVLFQ
jgi:hypothetical protein